MKVIKKFIIFMSMAMELEGQLYKINSKKLNTRQSLLKKRMSKII